MLKVEIKLDDEKLALDEKYSKSSIYTAIDKNFLQYDFIKEVADDGTISFIGPGRRSDYALFGDLITFLKTREWFMKYLIKWLWYNSDDGENEEDFCVEDILYHYTKKESVA